VAISESSKIGRRGTFVIPAPLRERFGLEEGDAVIAEETDEGILIRPAVTLPVERYSARRKAELLLANVVDEGDYERIREEIRALGIDPDSIPHDGP